MEKITLRTYKTAGSWKNRIRKIRLGALIRKTPGGRHGIYESNVGYVRKPLQ